MKRFFKDNSYIMVKMLVNQLGLTVFGFIVISAVQSATSKDSMLVLMTSLFAIAFYLFLLGNVSYEIGQKDGIKIEAGRMEYKKLKFFYISLCANAINFLLGILTFIGKLCISNVPFFAVAGENSAPSWAASLYSISDMISGIIQMMYRGLIVCVGNEAILNMLIPIPAVVVCTLSYMLGVRFRDGMFPKKQKAKEKYNKK